MSALATGIRNFFRYIGQEDVADEKEYIEYDLTAKERKELDLANNEVLNLEKELEKLDRRKAKKAETSVSKSKNIAPKKSKKVETRTTPQKNIERE